MAKFQVPTYSEGDGDSQATNLHTQERVEAWLAKNGVKPLPSSGAGPGSHQTAGNLSTQRQIGHVKPEAAAVSEVFAQESLQEHFGFETLKLCWNPRVRFLFKHAEGNSVISVKPEAAQQEIAAEPAGVLRRPGEPLVVKLLGSLQSRSEVKSTLTVKSIRCDLYYSPNSDNVVLYNTSSRPLSVVSSSGTGKSVDPRVSTTMVPEYWKLSNGHDSVDLQLLPCRYFLEIEEKTSTAVRRPADEGLSQPSAKRAKMAGVSTSTTKSSVIFCLETPTTVWTGVNIGENQLVKVIDIVTGDIEYSVRRLTNWAHQTRCSEAFKAIIDDGKSDPEAVVVKVIAKPCMDNSSDSEVTMQAAKAWLREFHMHRRLQHVSNCYQASTLFYSRPILTCDQPCIAGLRGWDSRTLSLFVEYKQSQGSCQ